MLSSRLPDRILEGAHDRLCLLRVKTHPGEKFKLFKSLSCITAPCFEAAVIDTVMSVHEKCLFIRLHAFNARCVDEEPFLKFWIAVNIAGNADPIGITLQLPVFQFIHRIVHEIHLLPCSCCLS